MTLAERIIEYLIDCENDWPEWDGFSDRTLYAAAAFVAELRREAKA